jgi:hypothetical protein
VAQSYHYIPWILEQEHEADFKSVQHQWRPRKLLQLRQVQLLLKDIGSRLYNLELARGELASLTYGPKYLKYLKRMRLWVRQASFSWQADQLTFLKSVAGFYSDYGSVLRMMRIDQLRGVFNDTVEPNISTTTTGLPT